MTTTIIIGIASFFYVFLRAFQQLNVVKSRFTLIIPTSYLMSFTDVFVIFTVASSETPWILAGVMGTGAWIGAISAVLIHKRIKNNE